MPAIVVSAAHAYPSAIAPAVAAAEKAASADQSKASEQGQTGQQGKPGQQDKASQQGKAGQQDKARQPGKPGQASTEVSKDTAAQEAYKASNTYIDAQTAFEDSVKAGSNTEKQKARNNPCYCSRWSSARP
jgi:hypothetical protein